MPTAIKLIVGLGNPGPEHAETRHNAGFWFVDAFASEYSLTFKAEAKFQAEVCRLNTSDTDCWLCKPMTFMNESGQAVQSIANFYKISLQQILVIHDEIDMEVGQARLKKDGGHGGHNGLRDIIEKMGGNTFLRLRIGVGHPGNKERVTPHVLGRPGKDDYESIMDAINKAMSIIPQMLKGDVQKAMNELHKKDKPQDADDNKK